MNKTISTYLRKSLFSAKNCHQHLAKSLCHMFYPPYDPASQQTMHICKEMCQDIIRGCWDFMLQHKRYLPLFLYFNKTRLYNLSFALGECEYLPSVLGQNSNCFYEQTKCGTLPMIPNANIIEQVPKASRTGQVVHFFNESCLGNGCYFHASDTDQRNTSQSANGLDFYPVHTEVIYSCANNKDSKSIRCFHSGEWSEVTACKKRVSSMSPIFVVFPIFFFPALSFVFYLL